MNSIAFLMVNDFRRELIKTVRLQNSYLSVQSMVKPLQFNKHNLVFGGKGISKDKTLFVL